MVGRGGLERRSFFIAARRLSSWLSSRNAALRSRECHVVPVAAQKEHSGCKSFRIPEGEKSTSPGCSQAAQRQGGTLVSARRRQTLQGWNKPRQSVVAAQKLETTNSCIPFREDPRLVPNPGYLLRLVLAAVGTLGWSMHPLRGREKRGLQVHISRMITGVSCNPGASLAGPSRLSRCRQSCLRSSHSSPIE